MSPSGDDDSLQWGGGPAQSGSTPTTLKADIKPGSFAAEGPAASVQEIYRTAGLYTLLESLALCVMSIVMLAIAAFVVVYAPPERPAAVFLIAIPSVVLALAVGGFATIKIKATLRGVELAGQSVVKTGPPKGSRRN